MVCPKNFNVIRADRDHSKGGGVLVLFKSNFQVSLVKLPDVLFIYNNNNNFGFCIPQLMIKSLAPRCVKKNKQF